MPNLRKNDAHKCLLCDYSSKRGNLKVHLNSTGKKGPRCPGLKVVIPYDIWSDFDISFIFGISRFPQNLTNFDDYLKTFEGVYTGTQKLRKTKNR